MKSSKLPIQPRASTEGEATQKQVALAVQRKSERFDAFLSHNSQDKPDVEKIREKLEAAGIKVWIDRNELSGGDSLPTTLKSALQNSAACVVCIGAHGVGPWQEKEIAAADKLKRPKRRMIPVFLPGSARELPMSLKEKELLWIEFRDFDDQLALDKLTRDIRAKVKGQSRWDRTRRIIIAAGVLIPLMALAWAAKEFCTFQAEFASWDDDGQQLREIIITRRLDPRPKNFKFSQGTLIFRDELLAEADEKVIRGMELNVGFSPNWKPLETLLNDARRCLAELEWLERPVSDLDAFVGGQDAIGWGRAANEVNQAFVARLRDSNSEIEARFNAAKSLAQIGTNHPLVIQTLVELLNVRKYQDLAAFELLRLGMTDDAVIQPILEQLNNSSQAVRFVYQECVAKSGTQNSAVIKALVAQLDDTIPEIRVGAALALAKLGNRDASVIRVLSSAWIELSSSQDVTTRMVIAQAMGQFGKTDMLLYGFRDSTERALAAKYLGRLGKHDSKVIKVLTANLESSDRSVQFHSAASLVQLQKSHAAVTQVLFNLCENQNRQSHSSTTRSKAHSETPESAFVALLKDQPDDVRSRAAECLGQLGKSDANVIEALVMLLKDQVSYVRYSAAEAIGTLSQGRPEWTDKRMITDLADNDSSVRERAGIVLAYRWQKVDSALAPEEARRLKEIRDQVERLRKDARPWVRQASLHALYHIEKRKAELEEASRTSPLSGQP